jgi:hypothetical protein
VIFEEMCGGIELKHPRVGRESHKSSCGIGWAIRTLRERLTRDKGGTLEERVGRIEKRYNNTHLAYCNQVYT